MEKKSAYGIEFKLKYPKTKQTRGSQDKCIMEMILEGSKMCRKDLASFNRPCKCQQAIFLSDISTPKGDKIDKLLMSDWQETHEGLLGKNRSAIPFSLDNPTKEDWKLWRKELSKFHTPAFKLLTPLDRWKYCSARVWRYYYDKNREDSNKIRRRHRGVHTDKRTKQTVFPLTQRAMNINN